MEKLSRKILRRRLRLWYTKGVKKQGGFTILEVTLFLAISALVAAALLAGLTAMVNQQQWRDSLNSMRTLIQNEYQNVRSGINDRSGGFTCGTTGNVVTDTTTTPGTAQCVLVGRVIQFASNSYTVSDVVAMVPVSPNDPAKASNDVVALNNSALVINNTTQPQPIPWQNTFSQGVLFSSIGDLTAPAPTATASSINTIAILHSPISSSIMVFGLNGTSQLQQSTIPPYTSSLSATQADNLMAILIKDSGSSSSGGAICLGAGSSSSNIVVAAPIDISKSYIGANSTDAGNLAERCQAP